MAQNVKAADLIGKTIVVGNNQGTITVKSVQDNGNLACEFVKAGETEVTPLAVTMPNLQKMTERGLWKIMSGDCPLAAATAPVTTEADVQEVQDIVPVVTPKKETHPQPLPVSEKPAAKVEPISKPKQEKPKAKTQPSAVSRQPSAVSPQTSKGTLTYETYENKKGKTCAKIIGFNETDKAYVNAAELHGSASWNNSKDGKVFYLLFGHRYVEAARLVCEALNAGKSFEDCKAIVDSKPKAESQQSTGEKLFTLDEVAQMLGKLLPEGAASKEDIKKLLLAA